MAGIIKLLLGVLLGAGVLIGGVIMLTQDEVTCGSQVMSSGEQCVTTSTGVTASGDETTRDYADQNSDNKTGGWIATIVGAIILLIAGLGLIGKLTTDSNTTSDATNSAR